MRVGIGYDIHRLTKGRKLFLGGMQIDHPLGLLGHSDADVLLHAIGDALLGAAGLGDIGEHFPDDDPRIKDISSVKLLKKIHVMIEEKGYAIENIDCIIFAEAPKITPLKSKMEENISGVLGINRESVNIKAKTMEKLNAVGQGKAIAASCIVLVTNKKE